MSRESEFLEQRELSLPFSDYDKWIWPKGDSGAWDGPTQDWITSHSQKYFENVRKKGVVITAGANMGLHARCYAGMFKHVFAFEPNWLNFHCLVRNCPYPNVTKIQAALGAYDGWCGMDDKNTANMGTHKVDPNAVDQFTPMMTIDGLQLWDCDLVQLDVEGWEDNVLRGAINTIKKFKPVVIVERNCDQVRNMLEPLGYQLQDRSKADSIFYCKE